MDYIGNIRSAFHYAKMVNDRMVGSDFKFGSAFFANANAYGKGRISIVGYNDLSCQVVYFGVVYAVLYDWSRGFIINRKCLA